MSLQGKVTAVEELTVTVEVVPKAECKGCHACSGLTGDGKPGMKAIKAIKGSFFVKPGDEVVLDLNPGEGSIAALLVFGFPMAAFFAGLFLAPTLSGYLGYGLSDSFRVICGFLGMGAAFALLAIFSRSKHASRLTMKVVKIVDPAEATAKKTCPVSSEQAQ
ncbi:MAG TPA: SoxR reducing system RseC family protein [Candidatus Rifleibacterium sp.]|jgi:positive regulator of sigma E activity|nr:SoxR reducing system RseC family protein [Candidatus Rifleibacterium sp.]HPW57396.1 SoxR reducing system RseC family protein [Candidatus Rifleibacterium sp.]